jgi:hypothetical protein
MLLFLTSCTSLPDVKTGSKITIANCSGYWNIENGERGIVIPAFKGKNTLTVAEIWGCDIFTSQTMRDILDNNEALDE